MRRNQPPSRQPANAAANRYFAVGYKFVNDDEGYPGTNPPWGLLNCLDLNTGKLLWRVPLGEYAELTAKGVPKTGTENFGGPTVTAGGLVFVAGTRDEKIRAFDKDTGEELWSAKLPWGGYAPPSVYEVNGREYVVITTTGGGKVGTATGDAWVAFALP
jgi:quinoprotein glucose dehydrogenase